MKKRRLAGLMTHRYKQLPVTMKMWMQFNSPDGLPWELRRNLNIPDVNEISNMSPRGWGNIFSRPKCKCLTGMPLI